VHFDVRPVRTGTLFVDRARDEFLTHAGLSLQQHRGVRFGHLLHTREHVFQNVALADDLLETLNLRNLLFQLDIFLFQPLLHATDVYQRRVKILFGALTLSDIEHHTHPAWAALAEHTDRPAS